MSNKRELLKKVFNNEEAERVPVGFWYHYAFARDLFGAPGNQKIYDVVVEGHKKMYDEMKPDFLKIMSDGFFGHPGINDLTIEKAEDLYQVKAVGADHPWITEQVQMVKEINDQYHDEVYTFYSIFSPLNCIRLFFEEHEATTTQFPKFFVENPDAMMHAANEVAKDLDILIEKIYENVELDGIYYSVQEVQHDQADKAFHEKYVFPTDLATLQTIKKHSDTNILHICGYGEYTNDLDLFKDYDLSVINWATHAENTSLKQGKEYFNDKVVIGGFDNNAGTLLDDGTDEEVEGFVKGILAEVGTRGVAIGADCTISPNIPVERFNLIRELGKKYAK